MTTPSQRWQRVLFATGHRRGGTTWLGRLLSLAQSSAYIFEPTTHHRHPRTTQVEALTKFENARKHWMLCWPPRDEKEGAYSRIVTQQIQELFDLYFTSPVETLIIKDAGAESVPLFQGILQPEISVYIKRHPISILNSYLRANLYDGWNIKKEFERCCKDIAVLRPDLSYLLAGVKDHEIQILSMCCLSHRLAEDWASAGKLTLLDYEDLAEEGPEAATQLFKKLGLQLQKEKIEQLNSLFSPIQPQKGFLDTEKNSKQRSRAYLTELAPWQLSKAKRYLENIGYPIPELNQNSSTQFAGTWEYCKREYRNLRNTACSSLSQTRKKAIARLR